MTVELAEPWVVRKGGGTCEPDEWAVLTKGTGRTNGCHTSRRKALAQVAALNANVDERARLEAAAVAILEATARVDRWRSTRRIEREGTDRVAAMFARQARMFVAELGDARGDFTEARRQPVALREAPDEDRWGPMWVRVSRRVRADFADALAWIAREAMRAGFENLAARLGTELSLDLENPRAIAYMQVHGAELVTRIDETTRGYLRSLLTEATAKGWSYQRTAREIRRRFAGFATPSPLGHIASRAELVAVTETAFAYEEGNRQAAGQLRRELPPGMRMRKSWITAGDNRVDEAQCTPNEADGWIDFEAEHTSGHTEPPAHPGCRCTEAYEVVSA